MKEYKSVFIDNKILISIPGRPRPKSRPRFSRKTMRVYSKGDTNEKKWNATLTNVFKKILKEHSEILKKWGAKGESIGIDCTFLLSVKDKKKWGKPHVGRPDTDNLLKLICDIAQDCNLFSADSQLTLMSGLKFYNDQDGVVIEIKPLYEDDIHNKQEYICKMFDINSINEIFSEKST